MTKPDGGEQQWRFLDKRSKAIANRQGLKLEFASHMDAELGLRVLNADHAAALKAEQEPQLWHVAKPYSGSVPDGFVQVTNQPGEYFYLNTDGHWAFLVEDAKAASVVRELNRPAKLEQTEEALRVAVEALEEIDELDPPSARSDPHPGAVARMTLAHPAIASLRGEIQKGPGERRPGDDAAGAGV